MSKDQADPKFTSEQHVANAAGVCPQCGATNITGGFVEIEGCKAFQKVGCNSCDATWNDIYRLVGYDNLETES